MIDFLISFCLVYDIELLMISSFQDFPNSHTIFLLNIYL